MTSFKNKVPLESSPAENQRGLLTHPAILLLLGLLCLFPCAVLFVSIDSGESVLRAHLLRIPVVFWAGWGVLSIWAALDLPKIARMLGRSTDPLGAEAMGLCALALLNCASALAFLFMRRNL